MRKLTTHRNAPDHGPLFAGIVGKWTDREEHAHQLRIAAAARAQGDRTGTRIRIRYAQHVRTASKTFSYRLRRLDRR